MTNAKLTSVYLQAEKPEKPWTDERNYQYPDKLLRQYIPQEIFDFFDRLHDPNVPDIDLFGGYDQYGRKIKGASIINLCNLYTGRLACCTAALTSYNYLVVVAISLSCIYNIMYYRYCQGKYQELPIFFFCDLVIGTAYPRRGKQTPARRDG